jgi:hypothetical protein
MRSAAAGRLNVARSVQSPLSFLFYLCSRFCNEPALRLRPGFRSGPGPCPQGRLDGRAANRLHRRASCLPLRPRSLPARRHVERERLQALSPTGRGGLPPRLACRPGRRRAGAAAVNFVRAVNFRAGGTAARPIHRRRPLADAGNGRAAGFLHLPGFLAVVNFRGNEWHVSTSSTSSTSARPSTYRRRSACDRLRRGSARGSRLLARSLRPRGSGRHEGSGKMSGAAPGVDSCPALCFRRGP